METDKELSVRIHYDWYGKCRTCRSWAGDRHGINRGMCMCGKSDLFGLETCTDGHCSEWYTYDEETEFELMVHDENM